MNRMFFTRKSIIFEILSYVLLFASFVIGIILVITVDEIPTNYDFSGNVTGYGSSATVLLLPAIMLLTNGTISITSHFMKASSFNMPFKVKPERQVIVFRDMMLMMTSLQFIISIYTVVFTLLMAFSFGKLMTTFTLLFLVALFADIIVLTFRAARHNQ